jgi:hypothetical protein
MIHGLEPFCIWLRIRGYIRLRNRLFCLPPFCLNSNVIYKKWELPINSQLCLTWGLENMWCGCPTPFYLSSDVIMKKWKLQLNNQPCGMSDWNLVAWIPAAILFDLWRHNFLVKINQPRVMWPWSHVARLPAAILFELWRHAEFFVLFAILCDEDALDGHSWVWGRASASLRKRTFKRIHL